MKKILILSIIALMAFELQAQKRPMMRKNFDSVQFDAKQIATLKAKRMALALELSESQQKQILALETKRAKKNMAQREAVKKAKENQEKPSTESRFERMNDMLDDQLAMQREMKKILTEDQYKKWKASQNKSHKRRLGHKRMAMNFRQQSPTMRSHRNQQWKRPMKNSFRKDSMMMRGKRFQRPMMKKDSI